MPVAWVSSDPSCRIPLESFVAFECNMNDRRGGGDYALDLFVRDRNVADHHMMILQIRLIFDRQL